MTENFYRDPEDTGSGDCVPVNFAIGSFLANSPDRLSFVNGTITRNRIRQLSLNLAPEQLDCFEAAANNKDLKTFEAKIGFVSDCTGC